jgi:AcrR family transcriptional regulator
VSIYFKGLIMLKTNAGASRMERKKEETKKKIVSTALDLFNNQGYDQTSMEQIAQETDIAKGTLYNYFPVKEAILSAYIQHTFQQNHSQRVAAFRALPNTRGRVQTLFEELLAGVQRQPILFEKFLVYRMQQMVSFDQNDAESSGLKSLTTEIIQLGQDAGEIRGDLPLQILEELLEFAFISLVKQVLTAPETADQETMIDQCVDLFLNGVKA